MFSATGVHFLYVSRMLTIKALDVMFSLSLHLHISLMWDMPCTRCTISPRLLVMWQYSQAQSSFFVSLRCQLKVLPKYERIWLSNTGISDPYFHCCPHITACGCPGDFLCTPCWWQIESHSSCAAVWFLDLLCRFGDWARKGSSPRPKGSSPRPHGNETSVHQ